MMGPVHWDGKSWAMDSPVPPALTSERSRWLQTDVKEERLVKASGPALDRWNRMVKWFRQRFFLPSSHEDSVKLRELPNQRMTGRNL